MLKLVAEMAMTSPHSTEYSISPPALLLTVMLPGPRMVAAVMKPGPRSSKPFLQLLLGLRAGFSSVSKLLNKSTSQNIKRLHTLYSGEFPISRLKNVSNYVPLHKIAGKKKQPVHDCT